MPVETIIDAENRLTIVEYINPWSLDDFYESFAENATPLRLADLTRAGPLDWVNVDVLRQIAEHAQKYDTVRQPGGRTAFLVSQNYAQILIKLFIALTEGEQDRLIDIQVFSSREKAMSWLLSDPDA